MVKSVERMKLPQVTICPTTPMTINVRKLITVMHSRTQFVNLSDESITAFAQFMIAGSGFQKMDAFVSKWNDSEIDRLTMIYDTMRNGMETRTFFYKFFDMFGLQCDELFQFCRLGLEVSNCCEIFEPSYLIRRGRCFKTSGELYQRSFDELGKLRLQMRRPITMDSARMSNDELIFFIGEAKPDIELFPRYFLYEHEFTRFRLTARQLNLLPGTEHCSEAYTGVGKATCYLIKWLIDSLENPYKCTFPYMDKIRETGLPSCDAELLVKNYARIVNAEGYSTHNCTLACQRWEYSVNIDRTKGPSTEEFFGSSYNFRADISYNDLQYEEITEVKTITFVGLLSQIGGQLSLFLGSSFLTIVQIVILLVILSSRMARRKTVVPELPRTSDRTSRSRVEPNISDNFVMNNANFYDSVLQDRRKSPERRANTDYQPQFY
ncbi:hypothetical protein AB6A40_003240 [Gnathostoma spinigerum]|uniref:Amiloride-sensitive sodium channel n=1 Tax=Gnathostoma spinigerum TaxID=75299 RepID=A0ABD6EBG0_9BILA